VFEFEKIVQVLEQKSHQTILEIDLNSIAHNLKQYQARLEKGTKVMAMVKAFAYGSGGAEIAGILQYHKIDYLGVAYADEGVELRKAGISVPIMVMNPEQNSFYTLLEYRLEPELYSFQLLEQWENFLGQQAATEYPVHIEIETGMNRLGFDPQDVERLADVLKQGRSMVRSVFSHLAASEDMDQDKFTRQQYERFLDTAVSLERQLGYKILKHIANSAAIIRHPYAHLDMVRLGIGLYGIEQNSSELDLQVVATLKSTVAQIKSLEAGDSVSYNRRGIVGRQSLIATIRIGYADGIPRRLGNGKGKVWVRGKLAPVIGTVCMDMIMIDITDIPGIGEGDEVVIFGRGLPVQELASWADTIPYEIMTGISQRVKRVYFME
jgi:Alr-MurF fusion protein